MSELKVNKVTPRSGTTVTIGDSGEHLALAGNIGLGGATPTTVGTGITFPATASASTNANTLDDYEEGTFTPTITGSSVAGTASYSTQVGKYTKIGNAVTIQINIGWSGGTGSGTAMYIVGLPFTSQSGYVQGLTTGYVNNIAMTAGEYCNVNIGTNTSFVRLFTDLVGGGASDDLPYDSAGEISVGGTYFI
jgi:hypothetical protein